jgi:hypothetical protein
MLETPKTGRDSQSETAPDVTMDNQQATLVIAGLYLGEGHFTLMRNKNGRGNMQYHTEVGFTNQDPAFIDYVCSWLETNEIPHFIHGCTGSCYQIKVQRFAPVVRLINLLEPYLIGRKLSEARILRRFVLRRMPKAYMGNNESRKYDETDYADFAERQSLRESSETIRAPECWNKHQHLKI